MGRPGQYTGTFSLGLSPVLPVHVQYRPESSTGRKYATTLLEVATPPIRRCFDSETRVTAPPGGAKEGRRETHKNTIAYSTVENGFIGVQGGSPGQ
eukprot:49852-Prymnesium_polylepis.1